MTLSKIGVAVVAAMSLMTGAVLARPEVRLTVHGYVVHGTAQAPKLDEFSDSVAPHSGDVIEWKIVANNASTEAARKVVTTLPVAPSTAFVAGTATGSESVAVTYSIDGGKTFSAKPTRVVHTPQGDVVRAADPATYTTVRWMQLADIAPKTTATFTYEARVK